MLDYNFFIFKDFFMQSFDSYFRTLFGKPTLPELVIGGFVAFTLFVLSGFALFSTNPLGVFVFIVLSFIGLVAVALVTLTSLIYNDNKVVERHRSGADMFYIPGFVDVLPEILVGATLLVGAVVSYNLGLGVNFVLLVVFTFMYVFWLKDNSVTVKYRNSLV
jgi:hypothetical protein